MSSRVMPRRFAIRSAASNWLGMSMSHDAGRRGPASVPTLAPSGTWLICSTPQATPMSMAPVAISPAIRWLACCAEPHWQSMVVAPVCHGRPAASQAVRVTLLDCAPAWVTQPPMACSTRSGVDARPLEQSDLNRAQGLRRVQAGQPAASLADRGTDCLDDYWCAHGELPLEEEPKLELVLHISRPR